MAHGTRDENRRADGQRPVNPVLPADALCPSGPENGPAEREFGRARDFLCGSGKAVSSRAAGCCGEWRLASTARCSAAPLAEITEVRSSATGKHAPLAVAVDDAHDKHLTTSI